MYAEKLKLESLDFEELIKIAVSFQQDLSAAEAGRVTNLSWLRSNIFSAKSFKDGNYLVIDIGGTNIKLALYNSVSENFRLKKEKQYILFPYKKQSIDIEVFLNFIAQSVSEYLLDEELSISGIGLSFSFPCKTIINNSIVDVSREGMSSDWGKGFLIENSDINISEAIRLRLSNKNINAEKWIAMNDTIALLNSGEGAECSVVVGTGYNIGLVAKDGELINTEAPFFSDKVLLENMSLPAEKFLEDALNLPDKGIETKKRLNEVQISGDYLFRLVNFALAFLCEPEIKLLKAIESQGSVALSMINKERLALFMQQFNLKLNRIQQDRLLEVVDLVINRSKQLVAAELSGALKFLDNYHGDSLQINFDGSFISGLPSYKDDLVQLVEKITKKKTYSFKTINDSSLLGVARSLASI